MSESGRTVVALNAFYGYPAERIAQWCCVSVETAQRWKTNETKPSATALRLFELHRDRRVLDAAAWDGWFVEGAVLVDPEGNETTQSQLRAYYLVYQLVRELAKDNPDAWQQLDAIRRLAG